MKSFFFCRISTYGIFSLFWRPFIQPSNWHWSTFHHSYSEEWRSTNENPIQFHGCGPISFIGRGSSSQLYFDAFNQIWGQKIPWIHSGSSIFCFTDFFNRSGIFFSIKSNILCFLCCLKPFFREMHFRTKHIFVLLKVGQLESILKSRSCVMQTMTRCDRYRQGHLQGHLYPWIQNRRCANILFSCLETLNCFLKYKLSFCCVSFVIHFAVVFALVFMTEARVFETFRAFPVTLIVQKQQTSRNKTENDLGLI